MDGRNEIIIGTYSGQIIIFEEVTPGEQEANQNRYKLAYKKQLAHPIYVRMDRQLNKERGRTV